MNKTIEKHNTTGRPTVLDNKTVKKLQTAFEIGANVVEACSYAKITRQTFYNNLNTSPAFFDKMQEAFYSPKLKALKVVMSAINKGDLKTAQWFLEKKYSKDFKETYTFESNQAFEKENTITVLKEILQEAKEANKRN